MCRCVCFLSPSLSVSLSTCLSSLSVSLLLWTYEWCAVEGGVALGGLAARLEQQGHGQGVVGLQGALTSLLDRAEHHV